MPCSTPKSIRLPSREMPDAVEDVELGLLERRRHLVLDDLDAGAVSDRVGAVLQRLDATDVEADRRVELQRLAAGGGLGRAEEDADLLAQLVDEDHRGVGLVETTGELAQRLRHESSLQTHVRVAHLALDLGLGHERGDGVDDDRGRSHRSARACRRSRAPAHPCRAARRGAASMSTPSFCGVVGVERVLGIDERGDAARALRVGDRVQRERRLTRGLRAVDLDDAATRAGRRRRERRRGRWSRWG